MRFAKPILMTAVGLLITVSTPALFGGVLPADAKTKLDDALKALAGYDFGGDKTALNTIEGLVANSHGQPQFRKDMAAKLAGVLQTSAPHGAKDFACRQLAVIGTGESVAALALLLTDEKLSHMARFALERIPGPAVDDALREAIGKVKGKTLVGVVNSIGARHDTKAVGSLAKLLGDSDTSVAGAAASALGKIGGPVATDALMKALAGAPAAVQLNIADGCLLCADRLLAQGKKKDAVAICQRLRGKDFPKAIRVGAMRTTILAKGPAGVPLLVEQLKSNDTAMSALALMLARQMPGKEVTTALAAEMDKLPAEKQALLLQAFADRCCPAATPTVVAAAKSSDAKVRAVAIQALGKLGDASAVSLLLDAGAGADADVAQAAQASLTTLRGKDVDTTIVAAMEKGDAKVRRVAIDTLGQRRSASGTAVLLKAAGDADESVRIAAIKALGATVGPADFGTLAELVAKAPGAKETAAAEAAVGVACARMTDKDACSTKLLAHLPQADATHKPALLRSLGQVGGSKALQAVRAATKDADADVQDAAVRALCDWPAVEAASDLADLAKTSANAKHKIFALRGYTRLISQSELPADKKLTMCKEAMTLATRDEERKLVLGALGGVPTTKALEMVMPYLENAAMKNEAGSAAVSIAEKLKGQSAQVTDAMKKVVATVGNASVKKRAETVISRGTQR